MVTLPRGFHEGRAAMSAVTAYDEMFAADGSVRPHYREFAP